MNKIIFSLAILISLFSTDIFSQESLIPLCANNLKTIQSYHTEIYFRDLLDKKTKDKNYNTIDWKVDFVSPDRVSVQQSAWTDGSGDIWIAVGKRIFRFFGAWIETPEESESQTFELHSFLLIDKYRDLLENQKPVSELVEGNLRIIEYAPQQWRQFENVWKFKKGYKCTVRIWIDPQSNLIDKAYILLSGKDNSDADQNLEITQIFTKYNDNIAIKEPATVNAKNTKDVITIKVISRAQVGKNETLPKKIGNKIHMAIISDALPNGIWEMGPDDKGRITTTNTISDMESWHTHIVTQNSLNAGDGYIRSNIVKLKKEALFKAIALYEKYWVGQKYNISDHNENYAIATVIYAAGGPKLKL